MPKSGEEMVRARLTVLNKFMPPRFRDRIPREWGELQVSSQRHCQQQPLRILETGCAGRCLEAGTCPDFLVFHM